MTMKRGRAYDSSVLFISLVIVGNSMLKASKTVFNRTLQ